MVEPINFFPLMAYVYIGPKFDDQSINKPNVMFRGEKVKNK